MRYIGCFVAFLAVCIAATAAFAQRSTPVQLVHPNGAANDQFGQSVAVEGDTIIVGAQRDDVGANLDQGSAHIYRWTGSGWTFEATLTAADGAASDNFGISVAISGDTMIVGATGDDVGANANQGSAYIFTRSGTTWTQQAKLTVADGAVSDAFGISVAVSGDTAIVGAWGDNVGANSNQGSAYIFTRSGATWTQQAQLNATDGAADDELGGSVAISGDTALVGAYADNVGAFEDQGSAYVFVRTGSTWTQQAQLLAADGATFDTFGLSVALSGDTAIVGASIDTIGANAAQGSAYVFSRSGTAWTQQAKLTAADGAMEDRFGVCVAIWGDTALVGANSDDVGANANQGSAYVFTRSGTSWVQQSKLTAADGAANDSFGRSIALWGDTAFVGAYFDDVGANSNQGSAWVFSRVGSRWIGPDLTDLTLIASDGAANDFFGNSVAISGDTAIVGAPADDVGFSNQGSAYIFVRTPGSTTWTQQARLNATPATTEDRFGGSVAISGDTVIVGTYYDFQAASGPGSVYVFVRTPGGTTWTQQARITPADGAGGDRFGYVVAISGDTAIVGANLDDVGANFDQGSAYVFTRSGTAWTQQAKLTAGDGAANNQFGVSVALYGDTAIVGAYLDTVGANTSQGSAYVFGRPAGGTTWTQQAVLTAADGAAGDRFGNAVSLASDTALVGAPYDDFGANTDQGSAYVFNRSGATWIPQAQLTATVGAASDQFGVSVALSGDTAIVGALGNDVGGNANQGSAYVFSRSFGGTTWTQQAQLTATGGASNDFFGYAVALSGDTAFVATPYDDIGANADQGSAWVFDVPADDFSLARNDVTEVTYPTLAAALLPAASGQQITATQAAWRSISSLDTAGRSLIFWSDNDLRIPSTSTITLGGSSSLNVDPSNTINIFGQLRASGLVDVTADSVLLGSRGTLTARIGSSLTINAPVANLQGQTRLEQGSSLTFSGPVETIGPVNAALNSTLTAGGTFTNIDTFSITGGTLNMPLFLNRAQTNIFGSSAIFGSFTNNAGATTTIRSGTLFVFGNLTNNGTIIGTICSNCLSSPPGMDVGGDLAIGAASSLTLPFVDSLVRVGGDLDCAINSNTRYDMRLATLQLEGAGAEQALEVMSKDIGADAAGLDRTLEGHYPIQTLRIGPAASQVRLVDSHDNDGMGQSAFEAIYVDTLQIDAGSRLINTSCRVFVKTLINNGTIDVPANLIKLGTICPADFDADGFLTFEDFDAFVGAFEAGSATADFDGDGFLTFEDFDAFVAAFEAGC